jgi:uncharacterized protein YjbI with pentapeptide repeats
MNNIIELKFKSIADDLYDVEFSAGIEGKSTEVTLCAKVPVFDPSPYRRYQGACQRFYHYGNTRIVLEYLGTFSKEDLDESAADLLHKFNSWAASPQFTEIAQAIAARSENLQVTISTECADLRRLPFHRLNLFPANTEAIFSGIEAKRLERTRHPDKIRILVILGDKTGIDIDADRRAIEDYCKKDAEVVFLAQPERNKLTAALADPKGWDIIFFSGHSCTEGDRTGRIFINATDSLTMDELKDVLQPAIEHRVQIAIFNSCDGLGITPVLEKLNIDRLIVMREPIPDLIAQEFLKSFLKAFTGGARFDDAVKAARQQLITFEDRYPYVSWLPVVIQNRLVSSPTWQSLGKIRSPYKGLEAFTQADAGNFYGREEMIERYAKLVAAAPLVPIIGASGSGKSSLVQAGLIPFLKQDSASDWQILTMRPGRNPFDALAKAIFNAERADLQTIELDVDLASDCHLLTQKLAQIRIPQHRILLFIDQFEELFTQSDDEAARQVFLQSLADAVSNAPNFVLVFTLRNDFLPTLQSDLQDHDFRQVLERYGLQSIGSMSRDRLEAAITKPVEKLGVEFESGLVDRLMKDVGTVDGSLPLLQLVLDLLWKNVQKRQLTHDCYDTIGGKDGMKTVLIKLADDVYDGFVKQGKVKEFKQVFLRLVTRGDTNTLNNRRIATRAEIETSGDNWREIVLPLSKERLLKTDLNEQGEEIVEVIHETLIQSWQRLAGWIDKHRHDLERIGEIEAAAIKWNRRNRSKQDLWGGKKLKDAFKFSKDRDLVIPFPQIANDFLVAGSRQQRWNRGGFVLLGMIVPGLALWAGSIQWNVAMFNNVPKEKCDRDLLTTATQSLNLLKYPLSRLDFKGRDLSCLNLSGFDLSSVDLTGSKLSGVDLRDVNLRGAKLSSVNLRGTNLRGAKLNRADLRGTNLNRADLRGTNLSGVDLRGVDLRGVNLRGVDLSGVDLRGTNLRGVDLRDVNLRDVNLTGANLIDANLRGVDLRGVDLKGVDLRVVDLTGVDLRVVDLTGANLSDANLSGANLSGANLIGANLSDANLSNANLTGANLRGADLSNANLTGANLRGADLTGVNLSGADLHRSDLMGVYLSDANLIGAYGINSEQVKLASNWQKAKYSLEFRKKLGLP